MKKKMILIDMEEANEFFKKLAVKQSTDMLMLAGKEFAVIEITENQLFDLINAIPSADFLNGFYIKD